MVEPTRAGKILLVKAVEEVRPDAVSPECLIDAAEVAGDLADPRAWLARRADFLLNTELDGYAPLLALGKPPRLSAYLFPAALAVGIFSNYLDPGRSIHVLFNPVTLLILWNLAFYVLTAVRALLPERPAVPRWPGLERPGEDPAPSRPRRMPWMLRPLLSGFWRLRQKLTVKAARARRVGSVVGAFAADLLESAWPRFSLLTRRALCLASIGIVLGAFAGMYIRGLGLEYNIVWRSTFITDPEMVARVLWTVFGPAAWVLGAEPPSLETAHALMTPEGMEAGYWIHIYAVTALLLVVLPRTLLALAHSFRLRGADSLPEIDLGDPYFQDLFLHARRYHIEKVTREIKIIVEVEAGRLSEGVSIFVIRSLYDARIVPMLRSFREKGGKIADLKERLESECHRFEPELRRFLDDARGGFEAAITSKVGGLLEVDFSSHRTSSRGLEKTIQAAAGSSAVGVGGNMGTGLADPVALAVSSALALVAGSVSGGFGESLGTALLVALGASGPVGFLIGALAGLVAAGGTYWLGREKLASGVEQTHLPATVVKTFLWEKRLDKMIDDGRRKCGKQVKEQIREQFVSLSDRLAGEIWTKVRPLLGERLRTAPPTGGRG